MQRAHTYITPTHTHARKLTVYSLFVPFSMCALLSALLLLTVKVCFDSFSRSAVVVCVCVFILHGLTVLESRQRSRDERTYGLRTEVNANRSTYYVCESATAKRTPWVPRLKCKMHTHTYARCVQRVGERDRLGTFLYFICYLFYYLFVHTSRVNHNYCNLCDRRISLSQVKSVHLIKRIELKLVYFIWFRHHHPHIV